MSNRIVLTLDVRLGAHALSAAELSRILQEAVEDRIRQGVFGPDDEIDTWSCKASTEEQTQLETIAGYETWEERCVAEAIDDHGLTDPAEIRAHMDAAQTDLDYLEGQDNTLEGIIASSRKLVGQGDVGIDELIQATLRDRGVDEDEPEPDV
jgi:hypothetical protein